VLGPDGSARLGQRRDTSCLRCHQYVGEIREARLLFLAAAVGVATGREPHSSRPRDKVGDPKSAPKMDGFLQKLTLVEQSTKADGACGS